MDNEMNVEEKTPLLSVIVPTYNRKEMLSDALKGILSQSLRDIEVIVVDDCSSDGTQDFMNDLKDKRIRYFRREKNTGVHYNYSLGLSNAQGKYIVFHDDDDYYTDYEFFRKAVNIFSEHEDDTSPIVCVCSNALKLKIETNESERTYIGEPGRVKGTDFILDGRKKYRKPASLFPTVFRTETLRQAGLGDDFMDDSETYWFAMLYGDAWFLADVIGVYRLHSESYTAGSKKNHQSYERRYKIVRERTKQRGIIYKKLCEIIGEKTARKFCTKAVYELVDFYGMQGKGFADIFRIYRSILEVSDFMPELKYILPLMRIAQLPRRIFRNVKFIRKFYRRIKYGNKV